VTTWLRNCPWKLGARLGGVLAFMSSGLATLIDCLEPSTAEASISGIIATPRTWLASSSDFLRQVKPLKICVAGETVDGLLCTDTMIRAFHCVCREQSRRIFWRARWLTYGLSPFPSPGFHGTVSGQPPSGLFPFAVAMILFSFPLVKTFSRDSSTYV
jgi:hypothetical protein